LQPHRKRARKNKKGKEVKRKKKEKKKEKKESKNVSKIPLGVQKLIKYNCLNRNSSVDFLGRKFIKKWQRNYIQSS
jgi:hypothetical protein